MNFSLYIAKRYSVSFSKSTAINIITIIASLGIVVSTMALFVVLSGFSGLRDFSLSFINQMDPDVKVTSLTGKKITLTPKQLAALEKAPEVAHFSKVIEERVLFSFNSKQEVAYVKGVDSNYIKVASIDQKLYTGQWLQPNTNQAVAGYGIAEKLSVGLYDFNSALEVFVPKPGKGNLDSKNAFNQAELTPVGIYAISDELDRKFIYTDLGMAQEILQFPPNVCTALEFKIAPNHTESQLISFLDTLFEGKVQIKNRAQLNESLYRMLNTENMAVYLIFTLVIIVALFNLVGALIMIILEKKNNLLTLYNIGVQIQDLKRIFLFQGLLLTVVGGIIGILLGIGLVFLQLHYNLVMITATMAYPVRFEFINIGIVLGTIFILGLLASLIASSRVSKKFIIN